MRRRATYLLLALVILAVEVLIATRLAHLRFIRTSLGDVLVVMLLYCLALGVCELPRVRLAAAVFAFACSIEISQYFHLVQVLELRPGSVLWIALGTTFQWSDILCYFTGCAAALGLDVLANSRRYSGQGPRP
jgi:hypothetical protein